MWFTLRYQDQIQARCKEDDEHLGGGVGMLQGKNDFEEHHPFRGPAAILQSAKAFAGNSKPLLPAGAVTSLVLPVGFPVGWGLALVPEFQAPLGEFVNSWLAEVLPKLWHGTAFGDETS